MAEDRDILREIWDGKVPVCFQLATEEVLAVDQPDPFFLLVPRHSYFPLVTDKVHRHFQKHLDSEKVQELWLEDEGLGIPLKWHYPIGVLFDLCGAASRLPWTLVVHFQNFPETELLHCPTREVVESHFISTVKEADSLKHRAQVVNGMQKKDHKQLWMGLQNDRFDQFWSVNRKLMEHVGDDLFKHIPYRIHQADQPFIQKLFRPLSDTGQVHTLDDLLRDAAPHTLPAEPEGKSRYKILIQGIEPPLESSAQFLSEHFSHPDNFLHICVVSR